MGKGARSTFDNCASRQCILVINIMGHLLIVIVLPDLQRELRTASHDTYSLEVSHKPCGCSCPIRFHLASTHSPGYHPHKILIRQGFTQRDYDYYVVLQHLTYSPLLLLYLICYTYTFLSTLHGQYQPNPICTPVDMYTTPRT
ncbi:hypothetical protein DFH08DRAFT_515359 [Mycena albidolilacea]|uniref:Uncharacterized protein n=1 Tax=Mycena albidolilacea TaxID=1033008 RepID=A0AAD6Z4K6_9AGAR|nr:hypothetical protein DFH08DRAFT_515359 [Mycena albidolilacea]